MKRKWLAVGVILLFVGVTIAPAIAQNTEKSQTSIGNWLYVGGSGPGNYTRIQDAINNSHDGDTVFVYDDSSPYNETSALWINRSINLLGEDKNTTIIEYEIQYNAVLMSLQHNNIKISGFTLQSMVENLPFSIISNFPGYPLLYNITISDNILRGRIAYGIFLRNCNFCNITHNTLHTNNISGIGIYLMECNNWMIANNTLNAVGIGIEIQYCSDSIISNNSLISNDRDGLKIESSSFITISNNYFFNNSRAISMEDNYFSKNLIRSNYIDNPVDKKDHSVEYTGILLKDTGFNVSIEKNFVTHCRCGILLENTFFVIISMNTFMKNIANARFYQKYSSYTIWNQNYWGRSRILPKPIFGIENMYQAIPNIIQFDWHPAQEPYDILGMSWKDTTQNCLK